ncbi:MAG: SGNH/GDSL hydrolase family protein [Acidobacteriota bacterium]
MGLLVGAVIAEIALRVAGYSCPNFYQLDQSRGYALRPGTQGWFRNEGEAYVSINSDGLHDREHSLIKPPGTYRIAVVGDSYAESLRVPLEEAFWSVMEGKLQEANAFPGKKVEVINFGVSGYGTGQELLTLREHVWKYSPDLVLLAFTTSNDVMDNSYALRQTETPYFVYRDGKLALDNSFRNSSKFKLKTAKIKLLGDWLYGRSRVVQAISEGLRAIRLISASWKSRAAAGQLQKESGDAQKSDLLSRSQELGIDNVVYLEPRDAVWNDAWRVTEGLIVTMRDEVKLGGAKFLVVTLSNGPQVLPDPKLREGFMKNFAVSDLFYPDNRIKSLCVREGIPVITLAPELQEFADRNNAFLHGFGKDIGNGHWNATGNRVAGELIAQKIREGVLLK